MTCTLAQAKLLVKKDQVKKTCGAQLKRVKKQTKATAACAKAAAVKGGRAAAGFKATANASNRQAFQQRLATLPKPSGQNTEGRVLQAMLAAARA